MKTLAKQVIMHCQNVLLQAEDAKMVAKNHQERPPEVVNAARPQTETPVFKVNSATSI